MNTITRWDPFRNFSTFQDQFNRAFDEAFRGRSDESVTTWSPAVDIFEDGNELILKADLPDMDQKDLDIRVENNMLTIRGERHFEKKTERKVAEENYLRVERAYGAFSRSFSLPNTVNTEAINAEYRDGVLTLHLPKREESKPKQIKVAVATNGHEK